MMHTRIEKNRASFDEALATAKLYNEADDRQNTIDWLNKAFELKPNGIDPRDVFDLDKFFASFTYLSLSNFNEDIQEPLLAALKKNNTITELWLGCSFKAPRYVNKRLANFIAESNTLTSLDFSTPAGYDKSRLHDNHMNFIADGLRFNKSIEKLNFADQHDIGDKGLLILLEALTANSESKLRQLNLFCTNITEVGAKALIEFLKNNKSLESINVSYNKAIPSEYVEEINRLTERNKIERGNVQKLEKKPVKEVIGSEEIVSDTKWSFGKKAIMAGVGIGAICLIYGVFSRAKGNMPSATAETPRPDLNVAGNNTL